MRYLTFAFWLAATWSFLFKLIFFLRKLCRWNAFCLTKLKFENISIHILMYFYWRFLYETIFAHLFLNHFSILIDYKTNIPSEKFSILQSIKFVKINNVYFRLKKGSLPPWIQPYILSQNLYYNYLFLSSRVDDN